MRGDLGDDLIYGFADGDYIDGGPGWDTVDYSQVQYPDRSYWVAIESVFLHPDAKADRPLRYVEAWDATNPRIDLLVNVEAIRGSAYADWIRIGLYRASEIQEIDGAAGDDTLVGYGAIRMLGGAGDDRLAIRNADGAVLTGGDGDDTFSFGGETTVATITDFSDGDLIRFPREHFGTIPDGGLQAMLDGSSGEVLNLELLGVDAADGNPITGTITLKGVDVADLTVDDFILG